MWIVRYLLNSFLNFTLSTLYFCMLFGRLKNFCPEYKTPLCTQVSLMVGKYRWFLFLVSRPCTYALVRKSCWFYITKSIRDSIYCHGTAKILSFKFLHDALGAIPDSILIKTTRLHIRTKQSKDTIKHNCLLSAENFLHTIMLYFSCAATTRHLFAQI